MATLLSLEATLRQMLGNLDPVTIPASNLYAVINTAYEYILDRFDHIGAQAWFSFNSTSGTANYAIPPNFSAVLRVFDVQRRRPLRRVSKDMIPRLAERPPMRPRWYTHQGPFLTLFDTPDAVYTFGALGRVTKSDLVNPTDGTLTDSTWDEGILLRARFVYHDRFGDDTKAATALASWKDWVGDKRSATAYELGDMDTGVSTPVLENFAQERYGFPTPGFTPMSNWFNEAYPE